MIEAIDIITWAKKAGACNRVRLLAPYVEQCWKFFHKVDPRNSEGGHILRLIRVLPLVDLEWVVWKLTCDDTNLRATALAWYDQYPHDLTEVWLSELRKTRRRRLKTACQLPKVPVRSRKRSR